MTMFRPFKNNDGFPCPFGTYLGNDTIYCAHPHVKNIPENRQIPLEICLKCFAGDVDDFSLAIKELEKRQRNK